jgi:DNA replication and repair protein RecF
MSKAYFYTLQDYNKVLAQRNKLLKSNRVGASDLEIWDLQLVKVGCKVAKNRWGFVQRLSRLVQSRHQQLSSGLETLVLEYDGYDASDVDALQQQFMHDLIQDRDKDIKHGYTHSGMHKDDIAIYINGVDVRVYGSQGQQRTTVLSLKLAQIDLIYDMYQYRPILLLDDVLGELDTKRRLKLLQLCSICQTIITATHVEDVLMRALDNPKVFGIDNGQIVGD